MQNSQECLSKSVFKQMLMAQQLPKPFLLIFVFKTVFQKRRSQHRPLIQQEKIACLFCFLKSFPVDHRFGSVGREADMVFPENVPNRVLQQGNPGKITLREPFKDHPPGRQKERHPNECIGQTHPVAGPVQIFRDDINQCRDQKNPFQPAIFQVAEHDVCLNFPECIRCKCEFYVDWLHNFEFYGRKDTSSFPRGLPNFAKKSRPQSFVFKKVAHP